jgi:uncharacterized protein (TIGR03000 family)
MFPRRSFPAGVPALAVAAVLATAGNATAQYQGYYYANGYWYVYDTYVHGYNPGYYAQPRRVSPHGVSPGHFSGYPAPGPYYTPPGKTTLGSAATYTYPWTPPRPSPTTVQGAPTLAPAYIEVRVPAGAELWFGDTKTAQAGSSREFVSPGPPVGREYVYEVRVRWSEGDREVTQTREITVRGGEWVSVVFTPPAPGKGRP